MRNKQTPQETGGTVVRSHGACEVQYAEVTPETIRILVHSFYGTLRQQPHLGEIFEKRLGGRWPEHLEKMERFWQSVLLKNGTYKGKPVPEHLKLKEVVSSDYGDWLDVFRPVAREIFVSDVAEEIIAIAERIAQSLWLATFGFAGSTPPAELFTEQA
ncbi:group III truncated hemoglobin [Roseibium sp. MB-4]